MTDLIKAKLDPKKTFFCLDLNHPVGDETCHSHFDENGPGDTVACECGRKWKLGDTIYLAPIRDQEKVPSCTKCLEVENDWDLDVEKKMKIPYEDPMESGTRNFSEDYAWEQTLLPPIEACARAQWKGTVVTFSTTCRCGANVSITQRDFVYNVICPMCTTIYAVLDRIPLTEIG